VVGYQMPEAVRRRKQRGYHAAVTESLGDKTVIMLPMSPHRNSYANALKYSCEVFDIIIIDSEPIAWRDDCVKPALDCLNPGGKLIIDNWQQPSVGWIPSEETQQLLSKYPVRVYPQEGHSDWKTAVFTKHVTEKELNAMQHQILDMLNNTY
jgi:hypothetical protein